MSSPKRRAVRSAAMQEGSSSAKLIRVLRERLKLSQQKFADLLGVTRLTASRWQSGGAIAPRAENFLVLARLAQQRGHFDLALKFWEAAGLTIPILRALFPAFEEFARQHEKRTFELPSDKEVVRLPLLEDSFFEGGHETVKSRLSPLAIEAGNVKSRVPFPSESVPHPLATVAVHAPDDYMWPIFRKGDPVAIECPFNIPADHPKLPHFGDAPIVAAFRKKTTTTIVDDDHGPLYLRRILLRGLEVTNVILESELGLRIAAARSSHLSFDLELSGVDFRSFFFGESIDITGNVHGLPSGPDPEWSILGTVVASVSSHAQRSDDGEPARGEKA